jgi:hypothetical protein
VTTKNGDDREAPEGFGGGSGAVQPWRARIGLFIAVLALSGGAVAWSLDAVGEHIDSVLQRRSRRIRF